MSSAHEHAQQYRLILYLGLLLSDRTQNAQSLDEENPPPRWSSTSAWAYETPETQRHATVEVLEDVTPTYRQGSTGTSTCYTFF